MYKTIVKNIFSNWAGLLFHMVVALFLSPFLVHSLGLEKYGIWVLFGQVVAYMGLMDMGIRIAVTAFIAKYTAKEDDRSTVEVFNIALMLYSILAAIIVLLTFVFVNLIDIVFQIAPSYLHDAKYTFMIVGITLATQLPANVFAGSISGIQRYEITNAIAIIVSGTRTAVIVYFLSQNPSLVSLAVITFCFEQLKNGLFVLATLKYLPVLRGKIQPFKWDIKRIKEIYSFSAYSFVINIATRISLYSDTIVIGIFGVVSQVAFYSIAWTLVDHIRKIVSKLAFVFAPAASKINALDEKDHLINLFVFGTRIALMITVPIVVFLCFFGDRFLVLWMGNEFTRSYPILLVLVSGELLNSMLLPVNHIILGLEKHKYIAYARMIEAGSNLMLSIILIHYLGLIGVALGTLIPSLLINAFFILPYAVRLANLQWKSYFCTSMLRPLVLMIVLSGIGYFGSQAYVITDWAVFIGTFLSYAMCVFLLAWFWGMTTEERELIKNKIQENLIKFNFRRPK